MFKQYKYTRSRTESVNNAGSSSQIREREFVKLGPSLWNEHSTLLHHSMEPGQGKQGLGPDHRVSLFHILLGPGFVGSLQVAFDSRGSLVCDLETGLQENGGKLWVALSCQPQPESLVGLQTVQLLLQGWQPA